MRTVVFVIPYPAEASIRFARAFAELKGVRLIGLVQKAPTGAGAKPFANFVKVDDAFDPKQLVLACEKVRKRYGGLHQIVGVLEPLQVALAEVRQFFGIPGTDPKTADLFRDKSRMKDALRAAGLPCARHKLITSLADAVSFVQQVHFPIVLKPPAGAGCKATWRIKNLDELKSAIEAVHPRPDNPTLAEEFLKGREYCFDTITVKGRVLFENVSRYYPGPLEVTENPWIQWSVVQPRSIADLEDARALGRKCIKVLGLATGFTHMEWFRREDGSLAIGEIAARPPGANFVEMMGFGHDADMYKAWARAITDSAFDGPYERKYAVGCAYLRGMGHGHGRVQRVVGVKEADKLVGALAVKTRLPRIGQPRSDHYEGEGYVIVRHPDTEIVKAAVKTIIETIRIEYA